MIRKLILIGSASLFVIFVFLVWYKGTYSMKKADEREVNSSSLKTKVLIATQGSKYKNAVVQNVIDNFKDDSVYFNVIDVEKLNTVKPDHWNAIIIFHNWEMYKPEPNSYEFLTGNYDKEKMFVVSTSGSGDNRIEGTDGITGASLLKMVDNDSKTIIQWLDNALRK